MEKNTLLVQLSAGDLADLIKDCVAVEIQKFKNFIQLTLNKTEETEIISRKEASELLKVSYPTLYHWNKNNILKTNKIGNRVYYLRSDVMDKLK
jgi:predicted DNA-binding transcriptional regulator AlpA